MLEGLSDVRGDADSGDPGHPASIAPVLLCIVLAGTLLPSRATPAEQPVDRVVAAQGPHSMRQLDWMVGEWKGSGWIESAESGRRDFSYSLNVRRAFDGNLLIADGVGYQASGDWIPYAEQLLISAPPASPLPGPPGTYGWREISPLTSARANEAKGTDRSLQVGYGFSRQDCDRIVADAALRASCRGGEMKWSRVTILLNDDGKWVQTREWQQVQGDEGSWHTYFKVVLTRAGVDGPGT